VLVQIDALLRWWTFRPGLPSPVIRCRTRLKSWRAAIGNHFRPILPVLRQSFCAFAALVAFIFVAADNCLSPGSCPKTVDVNRDAGSFYSVTPVLNPSSIEPFGGVTNRLLKGN
jgi:hypothetical protein